MSKINNDYADFSTHRLVVKALADDGVICNASTKEYDEQATFEGGTGSRYSFKKFNDKIIDYHEILKILSGEQRANIRETIPVIDFFDSNNTSLMNTYTMEEGSSTQVDPTTIVAVSATNPEPPAINYILEEDESIINRAVMGGNLAEHFWNSTGDSLSDYNIQTSPWNGEFSFQYKGIKAIPFMNIYGETLSSDRQTEIMFYNSTGTTWLEFTDDPNTEYNLQAKENEENLDDKGTKIPSINTKINGDTFLSVQKDDKYIIRIAKYDIIIALPAAVFSPDPCRILIYKAISNGEAGISNYQPYILYVKDFNPGFTMETLPYNSPVPDVIGNTTILNHSSKYLVINREYYSPASGLLNGYYCEPKERTDSEINPKVTKWLLNNDQLTATAKGVTIDIGSKYYPGHLLHRGLIKDQPLAITDTSNIGEGDEIISERNYKGKATYLFDLLNKTAVPNLLKAVTVPRDEWNNFNLRAVDQLIKREDFSGATISSEQYKDLIGRDSNSASGQVNLSVTVQYPNKFKGEEPGGLTRDEFRDYISSCISHIKGDTLELDILNDDSCCFSYKIKENGTSFNWGWITSTTGEIRGESGLNNVGNVLDKYSKMYYIYWKHYYKHKRKSTISACQDLNVKVASPINYFAKWGSHDTILIYPEYNKYFPTEMYLISRVDLGLEPYNPILPDEDLDKHNYTRGMCSFYNREKGKIVSFKVQARMEFLPSKVNRISFNSPLAGWITVGGRISGGKNNDCYIYVLQPMEIDLSAIRVKNWDNEEISLSTGDPIQVVPMSYPKGYFEVKERVLSGERAFEVDPSCRGKDVYTLQGSYIIPGIPEYENIHELRALYKDNLDLSIFANLIGEGIGPAAERSIKEGLRYILYNWPLSDDTTNPMLLGDIENILDGIIKLRPKLNTLIRSHFEIPAVTQENPSDENGVLIDDKQTINIGDLDSFFKRIILDEDPKTRYIYKPHFDTNNSKWEVAKFISGSVWPWNFSDFVNTIFGGSYKLAENIKTRFNNCFIDGNKPEGYDEFNAARISLTDMNNAFKGLFTSKGDLTRDLCLKIDNFFGQGTQAFLEYGNANTEYTLPGNAVSYGEQVTNLMHDLISNTDRSCKLAVREDALTAEYSKYFVFYDYGINEENGDPQGTAPYYYVTKTLPILPSGEINGKRIALDFRDPLKPEISRIIQKVKDQRGSQLAGINNITQYKYENIRVPIKFLWWTIGYYNRQIKTTSAEYYWYTTSWKNMSVNDFINHYQLNNNVLNYNQPHAWPSEVESPIPIIKTSLDKDKLRIMEWIKEEAINRAESASDAISNDANIPPFVSDEEIDDYMFNPGRGSNGNTNFQVWEEEEKDSNGNSTGKFITKFSLVVPDWHMINKSSLIPTSNILRGNCLPYKKDKADISTDVLQGISDFVKTSLEGTKQDTDNTNNYYVRYVEGDADVTGRKNSLYYKRYKMLNNRMNKLEGPLSTAARYLKTKSMFKASEKFQENLQESYKKFVEIVPISSIEPLSYFPPQETSTSTFKMDGKFYYENTLNSLRNQINSKCVLTCNYCTVRDSCPFYNEEEVLKLYCPEAETLDLWIKDNKLDLLCYDENSPSLKEVTSTNEGESLSSAQFQEMHKPYADILKKKIGNEVITASNYRSLETIRDQLEENFESFKEDSRGGIGFLLRGRYGTIQQNKAEELPNAEIDTSKLSKYKYMYDALFFKDEDTYITYMPSTHEYPVEVEIGPPGGKKVYRGKTKIMIPATLSILNNADAGDDIYLVSDDTSDATGKEIIPVIYIGKVGNLSYTFDLTDNSPDEEITDPADTNLYAKDVAQWSVNVIKGNCYQDPLYSQNNQNLNRDQYWMETLKKRVYKDGIETFIEVPGRKRENIGYQEPAMDVDNFDEMLSISGRPIINTYINFLRKFRIRLNPERDNNGNITNANVGIQWVDERIMQTAAKKNIIVNEETQKSALSFMKTNLRLAIVHKGNERN